jgi:hypothetical protein
MKKTFIIDDHTIEFSLIGEADSWYASTTIDQLDTQIEIPFEFHRGGGEIDWDHFQSFFRFISKKGMLTTLVNDSLPLATAMGSAFGRSHRAEIADWKMEFSCIFYNGKDEAKNPSYRYSYSLSFDFLVERGTGIDGDSYGLYLVDVEDYLIVGVRRLQR